jgi:hypothetical protein
MLKRQICGVIVTAALLLTGCRRALPTTPPAAAPGGPPPVAQAGAGGEQPARQPKPAVGQIKRFVDRTDLGFQLRNIGQLYITYRTEFSKSPAKLEDFLDYIKRDSAKEYKSLKEGDITLNLIPNQSSNTVLAYETDPYTDGTRAVVMGDGSVNPKMTADEFEKANPKKK